VSGQTQSFGIYQAYYGRDTAVEEGIITEPDSEMRAGIAAIGSLANGGIVAFFGIVLVPWLPLIGRKVKLVCITGALLMTLSLATASASTRVSD
jgi:hypothetical protein